MPIRIIDDRTTARAAREEEAAGCWAGCWGTGGSWAGCWGAVEEAGREVMNEVMKSAVKGEIRLSQVETAIKELTDLAKKK